MNIKTIVFTVILTTPLLANAALVSRLGGLAYYDTEANLTWLARANNGLGSGGSSWDGANNWVASINIDGITGWRLPSTLQPDYSCSLQVDPIYGGFGCSGSEMGNMFYNVLGGQEGASIHEIHNNNYDLFNGIKAVYWSGTSLTNDSNSHKWAFFFNTGEQLHDYEVRSYEMWAVHDGDVALISSVPVPAAAWLFGSALLGLVGLKRRQ